MKFTLGVIGAGVMANAIIDGAIKQGVLKPKDIIMYDINDKVLENMQKKGYSTAKSLQELLNSSNNILLAVKPQHYANILSQNSFLNIELLISIMAGVKIATLRNRIDNKNIGFARVMPNTPCQIAKGFCGICLDNATQDAKQLVNDIFSSCGETLFISEDKFDALTCVSGSGPAYIYTFLSGMIEGGVNGGLEYEDAKKMAIATMQGASELAKMSSKSMRELTDMVCSKGGTTIEAIEHFRKNDLEKIIAKGIEKCRKKSKELSETL